MFWNLCNSDSRAVRWGTRGVIICVSVALILWWSRSSELPSPAVQGAAVTAMDRCAACHPEQTESFKSSPHATTLRPMRDWPQRELLAKETVRLKEIAVSYQQR